MICASPHLSPLKDPWDCAVGQSLAEDSAARGHREQAPCNSLVQPSQLAAWEAEPGRAVHLRSHNVSGQCLFGAPPPGRVLPRQHLWGSLWGSLWGFHTG